MSWTHEITGLAGVAWLLSAAAAALTLALWVVSRARASTLVAVVITSLAFLAQMGSLTPRPQVVSFILAVLFADAWLRSANDGKPRWWLVPLSWLWACSHGMWFIGVVIGLATIVGLGLERTYPWSTLRRLAAVPALGILVAALTPVGPSLLLSPFQVHGVTRFIAEWQPPAPTDPPFVAFLLLLAIPVIGGLRAPSRLPWHVVVLLAMAMALALTYTRTVPIAAGMVTPIAAATASSWMPREPVQWREVSLTSVVALVGLAASGLLAASIATQPGTGLGSLERPVRALPSGTVLCNEWTDGGWLIWSHPNIKVTIDGRAELYSVQHIESYARFVAAEPGWSSYPARVGCEYALLPPSLAVVEALQGQAGWTELARGDGRVLLRSPD